MDSESAFGTLADPVLEAIAQEYKAIGVTLKITTSPVLPTWVNQVLGGSYEAAGFIATAFAPLSDWYSDQLAPNSSENQHGWDDPTLDKLDKEGEASQSPGQYWKAMTQRIVSQGDEIPVFNFDAFWYTAKQHRRRRLQRQQRHAVPVRMVRQVAAAPACPVPGRPTRPGTGTWRPSPRTPSCLVVARRILMTVPLLFVVSALTFVLVSLQPGDAAEEILGTTATPQEYAALERDLGLNRPLYEQYWSWLGHAVRGDLGQSIFTNQPVAQAIGQRLPVTLSLLIGTLLVSVVIGVGLGVFSALRGGAAGRAVDALALIGFSLPAFWVGAELIVIFAVWQHWFPATGYVAITASPAGWLRSLVLPVAALSLYGMAATAKQTREAMLDVLGSEYIRMARANGISPGRSSSATRCATPRSGSSP